MNNKQLKQLYSENKINLRIVGGKNVKYRLSSYDYLPKFPIMTVFSKDAIQDINKITKEYKEFANL